MTNEAKKAMRRVYSRPAAETEQLRAALRDAIEANLYADLVNARNPTHESLILSIHQAIDRAMRSGQTPDAIMGQLALAMLQELTYAWLADGVEAQPENPPEAGD